MSTETLLQPRRMVSFDDSLRVESAIEHELDDIVQHGFNSVVFCLTETDLQQRAANTPNKSVLVTMLEMAKDRGLYVGVDPWNMGNIFGGEAVSAIGHTASGHSGGLVQHQADPFSREFNTTWHRFLDVASRGRADFVFMDEPQLAPTYSQQALVEFLDQRTTQAHEFSLATDVCLTVNHLDKLGEVVTELAHVDGISADPIYGGGEASFSNMPGTNNDSVEAYVGASAQKVQALARVACKQAGVWVQGHGISEGHEHAIIEGGVREAAKHVPNIGYWRTHYSNIRPVNPELAWKIAGQVFTELAAQTRSDTLTPL